MVRSWFTMFTMAETVWGRYPDRVELTQTTKTTLRHLMLLGRRRRELDFHFKFGEGAVCYRVEHRSLFVSSHRHILANIAECGGISVLMILSQILIHGLHVLICCIIGNTNNTNH
jgi:hypothetical protein